MKVFITKLALTQGIVEAEVEQIENPKMVLERGTYYHTYYHGEGKEWHRTKESAIKRAESMRAKRLKSLRESIKKLESLSFQP